MRLQTLGDNLSGSTLYQFSRNTRTGQMRMLYVSGTWESVTGITAKDVLTDMANLFNMVDPDKLPILMQSIENSARTMTNYAGETRIGDRWVHVVARPRRDGTLIVWDCIMTNITERKETERQLEAEKERLQMLGDNLPGSSLFQFVRDNRTRQMRLTYVSATWETVTGISADEAMADITKVFSTVPSEDFPDFLKSIEESARTMSIHKYEIRLGDRWVHIVSRPRIEEKVIIWDGIITDITERKSNEADSAKYRKDLERELEKYRTQFDQIVEQRIEELNRT